MSSTCPTCGDVFDSEMGMKVHHSRIHDESIKGQVVECDNSGCDNTERRNDYEIRDNVFCSTSCEAEWKSENQTQEDHPRWDGGDVSFDCELCGGDGSKPKSAYEKAEKHFCSESCRTDYITENKYKGNQAWRRSQKWRNLKQAMKEDDDYTCQRCGERGGELNTHHIEPVYLGGAKYDESNLTTLCKDCHDWTHENKYTDRKNWRKV